MKYLFSLALVTVFSSFLFSCEKESVEPALDESIVSERNTNNCITYSYFNKLEGVVNFGKPNGKEILVGFTEGTTPEVMEMILNRYPQFDRIAGEFTMDSGILTRVKLHDGSTCFDTERFMSKLINEGKVLSVNPMFTKDENDPNSFEFGLTNELLVFIEGEGAFEQLQNYAALTKTQIVVSLDENTYIVSADKFSTGSILEISTSFNKQSFVTAAYPNEVVSVIDQGSSVTPQTTKSLGIRTLKSLKN